MIKNIINKISIFILIFSLTGSYIPVNASTVSSEAIFLAESFGIFPKEADDTMNLEPQMTRAELAHAISAVINNKDISASFAMHDINDATPYAQEIYTMMLLGIMHGDGNGYFRPDDAVSGLEASIVLLRVLGYGKVISGEDWTELTLQWGQKTRLLKNVNLGDFRRSDFVQMLYNAFDINIMNESYVPYDGDSYYITNQTLSDMLFVDNEDSGSFYDRDIVLQTPLAFIDVPYASLEKDEVVIGDTIYKIGDTNAIEYLGMEVQFFAKKNKNGVYELINISPTGKNEVIHIDIDDFGSYSHQSQITYFSDDSKMQRAILDSNTALIKNFDTIAVPPENLFEFTSGEVVLINNDGDSIIDAVLVYSQENLLISGTYDNVVTLKEGFYFNGVRYLKLDEESDDVLFVLVNSQGKKIDVDDLTSDSVITVISDRNGKVLYVIANEKAKATAELTSFVHEEPYDTLEFDGTYYKNRCTEHYTLGKVYDYYLNFKGDLVYYELADDASSKKYAYVIAVAKNGGLSDVQIKLVVSEQVDFGVEVDDSDEDNVTTVPMLICQNKEVIMYTLADKVQFNGTKVSADEVKDLIAGTDRIFEYSLNSDGELAKLNSPIHKAGTLQTTYTYSVYDKCFGGAGAEIEGFAINETTQILCLPDNSASTKDYMVKNVINLEGNAIGYRVRGYDYNENTKKCGLVVINREMRSDNVPGVTMNSSTIAIAKGSSDTLVDDEIMTQIEFNIAGEDKKMFLTEAAEAVAPKLRTGDLFVYEANYNEEIANILKVCSASNLNSYFNQTSALASGASEIYGLLKEIKFDEVDNVYTRLVMHFVFDVDGTEVIKKIPQRNKPPIYVYNGRNFVRSGTIEDVVPGDNVYLFMKNASDTAVILVNK